MKRRSFVRNLSISAVGIPLLFKHAKYEAIAKKLFSYSRLAEDRVLVILRLNGGNDGLNTVIPLDQYDNLVLQRSNIIQPQNTILPISPTNGFHTTMTGMASLFKEGQLSIVQNVGYAEQNRSHFRSSDIWNAGTTDSDVSTGWIGRLLDEEYPNYPDQYPNLDYPDPFVISMGYQVSANCLGSKGNFSYPVPDPFQDVTLNDYTTVNDGTMYGDHLEYMRTIVSQTNQYGKQVLKSANQGNSLSTLYDPSNQVAMYLRNVAQMISGGLKTKIYVLNLPGFDTHAGQVDANDSTKGAHADLLKKVSDAVHAFQDDLNLLGIDKRVVGMTLSEFGRQVGSNSSRGTDHGDGAPLFLFGSCINTGIVGPNPVISATIEDQVGVPMEIDFRDVYASVLKDWFEVGETEIQSLFDHNITYLPLLKACNLGLDELSQLDVSASVYPNPSIDQATLTLYCKAEWVKVLLFDASGRELKTIYDGNLEANKHLIPFQTAELSQGNYHLRILKESGLEHLNFVKINQP